VTSLAAYPDPPLTIVALLSPKTASAVAVVHPVALTDAAHPLAPATVTVGTLLNPLPPASTLIDFTISLELFVCDFHGPLAHSSTSMSQLPVSLVELGLSMLSITVHSVVYSLMNEALFFERVSPPYSHTPFAYPSTHVHWYAWIDTVVSTVESVHVAPFLHGLLLHSSTSMSQLPPSDALALLSVTVHSLLYCATYWYVHSPFANPFTQLHEYVLIETD